MIYDITQELRDFTYITSVYKCIATYNLKGHQIGRKLVICLKFSPWVVFIRIQRYFQD